MNEKLRNFPGLSPEEIGEPATSEELKRMKESGEIVSLKTPEQVRIHYQWKIDEEMKKPSGERDLLLIKKWEERRDHPELTLENEKEKVFIREKVDETREEMERRLDEKLDARVIKLMASSVSLDQVANYIEKVDASTPRHGEDSNSIWGLGLAEKAGIGDDWKDKAITLNLQQLREKKMQIEKEKMPTFGGKEKKAEKEERIQAIARLIKGLEEELVTLRKKNLSDLRIWERREEGMAQAQETTLRWMKDQRQDVRDFLNQIKLIFKKVLLDIFNGRAEAIAKASTTTYSSGPHLEYRHPVPFERDKKLRMLNALPERIWKEEEEISEVVNNILDVAFGGIKDGNTIERTYKADIYLNGKERQRYDEMKYGEDEAKKTIWEPKILADVIARIRTEIYEKCPAGIVLPSIDKIDGLMGLANRRWSAKQGRYVEFES